MDKHTCETCVYERDSSPSQHCDSCSDVMDNWRAAEPVKCPCKAYEEKEKQADFLTLGLLKEKNRISAIQRQYNKDVLHLCENKPPKLYNGFNACLSCKLRETCKIIYADRALKEAKQ